jgi:hypothetical protein
MRKGGKSWGKKGGEKKKKIVKHEELFESIKTLKDNDNLY